MALTVIESNNKLIQFTKDINREFVRENMFSPYMGDDLGAIIRKHYAPKQGGEQMNIPLVTKLTNAAVGVGTLVGNEEKIDNYGMRMYVDWARNAVVSNKAEAQKDSADIFGEAKPMLKDWGLELQRDEIIAGFMALPSASAPTGLGSANGQRVNGILWEQATDAQRTTWSGTNNSDRVVFGNVLGNNAGSSFATDLAKVDISADGFTSASVQLLKRVAKMATPAIRPYKTPDGYEYFVAFAGTHLFRDLKANLATAWTGAQPREKKDGNPLFQDGDIQFDGVIVREVPEISSFVTDFWTDMAVGGGTNSRVEPVFLCGKQAMTIGWGQMAKPTFRQEDDYQFVTGVGVEMCYGICKNFKAHPMTGSVLKQWGVVTGFYRSDLDA